MPKILKFPDRGKWTGLSIALLRKKNLKYWQNLVINTSNEVNEKEEEK